MAKRLTYQQLGRKVSRALARRAKEAELQRVDQADRKAVRSMAKGEPRLWFVYFQGPEREEFQQHMAHTPLEAWQMARELLEPTVQVLRVTDRNGEDWFVNCELRTAEEME